MGCVRPRLGGKGRICRLTGSPLALGETDDRHVAERAGCTGDDPCQDSILLLRSSAGAPTPGRRSPVTRRCPGPQRLALRRRSDVDGGEILLHLRRADALRALLRTLRRMAKDADRMRRWRPARSGAARRLATARPVVRRRPHAASNRPRNRPAPMPGHCAPTLAPHLAMAHGEQPCHLPPRPEPKRGRASRATRRSTQRLPRTASRVGRETLRPEILADDAAKSAVRFDAVGIHPDRAGYEGPPRHRYRATKAASRGRVHSPG